MTTLDHGHAHAGSAWPRLGAAIARFWTAYRHRRAFYRLGEMSDRELADIGLTRSDLSVAIDVPFGSDPTTHLAAAARRRAHDMQGLASPPV